MESSRIVEFLKDKSILITGSTGFLAKIFLHLINSFDLSLEFQILGKDLFKVLRDKHGDGFHPFVASKLFPVAGDIVREDLGIQDANLREKLWKEVGIVVNVAATTSFDERYDVALGINALGAKHILEFARRCVRLEMLLHVSTAYVAGEQSGLILEKKFLMGETLKGDTYLDIEAELRLVDKKKRELRAEYATEEVEKLAMKRLGIKRARYFGWPNTYVCTKAMGEMLLGHLRGDLPLDDRQHDHGVREGEDRMLVWRSRLRRGRGSFCLHDQIKLSLGSGCMLRLVVTQVPGDMVVNAMMVTMAAHSNQRSEFIYHMSSSVRNPMTYSILEQSAYRYFLENPRVGKDGRIIKTRRVPVFRNMTGFRIYMTLRYKLPLGVSKHEIDSSCHSHAL
ncbi:hypothetical protein GW17_00048249 [Ensete ventricosum]|nr:hypothetical protein GW17_00048249 [Ensete ventricosum]